ncbi:hypothetical protein GCM10007063_06020 [Lentibacillus kapialis]|uniref:DUF2513 domain-containing protein n=1 Tax=Lentibacillus kapialis TaxID=340214 RepID=A0A917PP18_9BACI|nr:DUF2513 domain-containing protein [Lentibacillus kapialis]GGJ86306.1 hypothetical protein GCM10007063_06020 [Lentibacillus kapialis]
MELNHDCVRSVLIELEDKLTLNGHMHLAQLEKTDTFNTYGHDVSVYAILKLIEIGYLNGNHKNADNELHFLSVSSLTWQGHEFLDNIRDNIVWSKTKDASKKLSGNVSITMLSRIANSVLDKMLGL